MTDSNPDLGLRFFRRRKIRVQHQNEAAECGLACLAMILSQYGQQTDLTRLRQEWPVSLKGLTLAHLVNMAEGLSLSARPLRLELNELSELQLPCILHWGMDHFVVLERVGHQSVSIIDPAIGRRKLKMHEVSMFFSGVALELSPTSDFRASKDTHSLKLSWFFSNAKGIAAPLVQLFFLSAALQTFVLVSPFYSQLVIDDIVVSGDHDLLTVLAIGFGVLALLMAVTGAFRSWVVVYLSSNLGFRWSSSLFRHLIRLPYDYFEKRHIGDIQSRFGSLNAIRDLITTQAVEATIDGLMAATTVVVMYVYNPLLATVVVASVVLYLLTRLLLYEALRARSLEYIINSAKSETYFLESIRGVLAVKNFGKEHQRDIVYKNRLAEAVSSSAATSKIVIWHDISNQIVFGVQNVLVIWIAASEIIAGSFTIGMLVAFLAYKTHFSGRASALIDKLVQFRLSRIHLDRLSDIVEIDPEQFGASDESAHGASIKLRGKIELSNLWYRYGNNEPYVIQGQNLTVEPGEQIAIVGPSGCGKSTLMKIMVGLLRPERGSVLYDLRTIEQIGLTGFRRQIGVVMQNDQLLGGTLLDNITFFDPTPNFESVERSISLAGISDDISKMPMGLYTLVGDMGGVLSGGQKQRVMLARAMYHEPKILFLDEATSHLDSDREIQTISAVSKLNMTRIIIAHRQETIRHCDRIVRMNDMLLK